MAGESRAGAGRLALCVPFQAGALSRGGGSGSDLDGARRSELSCLPPSAPRAPSTVCPSRWYFRGMLLLGFPVSCLFFFLCQILSPGRNWNHLQTFCDVVARPGSAGSRTDFVALGRGLRTCILRALQVNPLACQLENHDPGENPKGLGLGGLCDAAGSPQLSARPRKESRLKEIQAKPPVFLMTKLQLN